MKKLYLIIFLILNFEYSFAEEKIAYIDINYILSNSEVGQSISKHINNIKEKKFNNLKLIEKQLSEKEESLIKKKNIIEKSEFEKEINSLKKEIAEYRNNKKNINIEIEKKKLSYTKIVLNNLNPIISKYVEENSITIVFPKKNIIIAKKSLDITKPIIDLLNTKIKTIDF